MISNFPWKSAWIVGASTGIGAETARQLAASGVQVWVSARSVDKLEALAAEHDLIKPLPLDVADAEACVAAANSFEAMPDLILLNAAIYEPMGLRKFSAAEAMRQMQVNYGGVVHLLEPIFARLVPEHRGHVGIVASVNGYVGLPMSAGYGPTKAALHNLAESLYPELERAGVKISLINPGFVKSPLTDKNDIYMPQLQETDQAVRKMLKGLSKQRFEVIFPFPFAWIIRSLGRTPRGLLFWVTRKMIGGSKKG